MELRGNDACQRVLAVAVLRCGLIPALGSVRFGGHGVLPGRRAGANVRFRPKADVIARLAKAGLKWIFITSNCMTLASLPLP